MRLNKQIITIMVLGALLLSALGLTVFFYFKNIKIQKENNQIVTVYVAKHDIKQWKKIEAKDIKETEVARKYILTKPLLKKEIIGKYAKESIFKNDLFRNEKLSVKILKEKAPEIIAPFKYSSYNLKFTMFHNPNYALKKGDRINIVTVYPNQKEDGKSNYLDPFKVQYVANKIPVLGFLLDGKEVDKTIVKKEVTKIVKKKEVKAKIDVKAQEIILDIKDDILLNLIDDYNKGKQIWMVKTKAPYQKKSIPKVQKVAKTSEKRKTPTVRPYVLYKPTRNLSYQLSATIHYSNENKEIKQTKNVKNNELQVCLQNKKYILGKSKNIYFREAPSVKSKIKIYKRTNTIVPYKELSSDGIWYKTCDGYYIRSSQVEEISHADAMDKIKNKKRIKTIKKLDSNLSTECSKEYILRARTDIAHVRNGPSLKHKILQILDKNEDIYYKGDYDLDWYETCDGKFIHKFEVTKVKIDVQSSKKQ